MKRIIAIDYGDARTGVAVSDLTGTLAGEALTIQEWNAEKLAQRLAFFARERDAEKFVLGLPKNMDGTEGDRCAIVKEFMAEVKKAYPEVEVFFWDERLSTVAATRSLIEADVSRRKRKKVIDKMAAVFILQGFLDSKR